MHKSGMFPEWILFSLPILKRFAISFHDGFHIARLGYWIFSISRSGIKIHED